MTAAILDPYLRDWLDLLLRWLHVIAAMAWIGTSFYFVLLDQALRPPKRRGDAAAGVGGELWEVHGGGFYHVQKYRVAPPELPDHLAWFKWEAYTTWVSGFALLVVLYWLDAGARMVDPGVLDLSDWAAVGISAGLLLAAWVVYDLLCRLVPSEAVLGLAIAGLVVLSAWGVSELYAPRAAWLQVGAMLGTVMAGNVLLSIIPAHRGIVRAKEEGREPDPGPALDAKRRSVHNNYLTLPVLLTMLAGHFAFLYGYDHAWLILVALMALGAWARLFYNVRHSGRTIWAIPAVGLAALVALIVGLWPEDTAGGEAPTRAEVVAIVAERCQSCHGGSAPAAGLALPEQLEQRADAVRAAVDSGYMPLGNQTGMTDAEREAVAAWADAR